MTIHITISNMLLNDDDEQFISRRLNFAISRFSHHIRRINVHVAADKLSKPGFTIRVRMQAMLTRGGSVSVEGFSNDLHSGAATTADRIARSIERELQNRIEAARNAVSS